MIFRVQYYNRRLLSAIEKWPVGILADHARLVQLLVRHGPELGMPHSRALGGGLFELRPHGPEGIGRSMYCYAEGRRIVILHAFIKKTPKAQSQALALATKRMEEVKHGNIPI